MSTEKMFFVLKSILLIVILLTTLIFGFVSCVKAPEIKNVDYPGFANYESENLYIRENVKKKPGETSIGFVLTNDSLAIQSIRFDVYHTYGLTKKIITTRKIKKVTKSVRYDSTPFVLNEEGISFDGYDYPFLYLRARAFKHNIQFGNEFYMMLDDDFLRLNNTDKLKVMEDLTKLYN